MDSQAGPPRQDKKKTQLIFHILQELNVGRLEL